MDSNRFFLDQDESCHWYLVDADYRTEWDAWTSLDSDNEESWNPPHYAEMLGGHPNQVEFINPTYKDGNYGVKRLVS